MNRLQKNLPILRKISKLPCKDRKKCLKKCPNDLLKTIVDISDNLLAGNIQLPETTRKKLLKHANKFRDFSKRNESLSMKRKKLNQKGGIFPFLIPLLAALPMMAKVAAVTSGIAGKFYLTTPIK